MFKPLLVTVLLIVSASCGTPTPTNDAGAGGSGGSTGGSGGGEGVDAGSGGGVAAGGGVGGGSTGGGVGGGSSSGGGVGGGSVGGGAGGSGGGSAMVCTGRTGTSGNFDRMIAVGSTMRHYLLHVPPSYQGQAMPLLIALHGLSETSAEFVQETGFNTIADARGYIVAYPEGTGSVKSWNAGAGTTGCCGEAFFNRVDDVGFIRTLITTLSAEFCVDPKRVHATGLSNGGFMAHRLGCELSNVVASIGSCAGQLQYPACAPTRHVPVAMMHGTADSTVPYNGSVFLGFPSTLTTMQTWATKNACTSNTPMRLAPMGTIETDVWPCPADGTTKLYTVTGGDHVWFIEMPNRRGASTLFADFFDANPMP